MARARLEDGFVGIPNALYEALYRTAMPGSHLRVAHAVIRLTFGYQRPGGDRIGSTQLARETRIGGGERKVRAILDDLISWGVVRVDATKPGGRRLLGIETDSEHWSIGRTAEAVRRAPRSEDGPARVRPGSGGVQTGREVGRRAGPQVDHRPARRQTASKDNQKDIRKDTGGRAASAATGAGLLAGGSEPEGWAKAGALVLAEAVRRRVPAAQIDVARWEKKLAQLKSSDAAEVLAWYCSPSLDAAFQAPNEKPHLPQAVDAAAFVRKFNPIALARQRVGAGSEQNGVAGISDAERSRARHRIEAEAVGKYGRGPNQERLDYFEQLADHERDAIATEARKLEDEERRALIATERRGAAGSTP